MLAAVIAGAAIALGAALAAPFAVSAERTTAVGVAQREFRISPYRSAVEPGTVRFNVRNFGEDVHNLVVAGPRGFVPVVSEDIPSGRTASVTVRLTRPGRYRLLCTKADHLARGMRAGFRVRR